MKAHFGTHQKWLVRPAHREAVRTMFTRGLGAADVTPKKDGPVDVFELESGALVGVEIDDGALDEASARKGAWLEFLVADPDATARTLDSQGLKRVEYHDKEHQYFQAPGGPIFRLSRA
jgi:hypothetical protein